MKSENTLWTAVMLANVGLLAALIVYIDPNNSKIAIAAVLITSLITLATGIGLLHQYLSKNRSIKTLKNKYPTTQTILKILKVLGVIWGILTIKVAGLLNIVTGFLFLALYFYLLFYKKTS
ncbi:MAG: hypothetical protein R3B92_02205 [Patescibacteria group bacterium]|uniref:Uncharacterized protein n=1 Tax=candidate division WWE3 bacterium TaxID=2053526 RepID=A0A955ECN3_UNCKA|nr:hypothetical protein [candidate division WWE3 bacterium]